MIRHDWVALSLKRVIVGSLPYGSLSGLDRVGVVIGSLSLSGHYRYRVLIGSLSGLDRVGVVFLESSVPGRGVILAPHGVWYLWSPPSACKMSFWYFFENLGCVCK